MSCDETPALVIDKLRGVCSPDDERRLSAHLDGCPACRAEVAATETAWQRLSATEVEVPSARLRARFYEALAAHEAASPRSWWVRMLGSVAPPVPALAVGLAVASLVIGFLVGRQLPSAVNAEVTALRSEVRAIGFALLDHQSASERLLGVEWAGRATQTPEVVDALLERVQYDPNMSVRVAAIEALRPQLAQPRVNAALASTLGQPGAPLLQVTLADALIATGDAMAIDVVRAALASEGFDPAVREYVDTALRGLDAAGNRNTDI